MPSVLPASRRASTTTCLIGLINDSQLIVRARSQRSVPVSPTMENGISCGAGPLPDTTSRYLVGFTTCISTMIQVLTSYQQFGLDGSSPPKRTCYKSLPPILSGTLARNDPHSGYLSVGSAWVSVPTVDSLTGTPETWLAIYRPPKPRKYTPVPSDKVTQKNTYQKQE